ncbi:MAG TPA: WD40 repeat domain-containing protein [Bacteroidia bacterium]|nr:WD40 repeat domain-containing protein [Bacteroidia bacterium]
MKDLRFLICILFFSGFAQEEKKPLQVFLGHSGAVNSIDVSKDGKHLISGSKDETIRVWDLDKGELVKTMSGLPSSAKRVEFNSDGTRFLAGLYENFFEFEFPSCKTLKRKKKCEGGFVETVCYSGNGELILTSGWRDNTLNIWKYKSLKKLVALEETEWTDHACFNKNANIVLSGSHDNKVKLWDVSTGKLIKSFAGHDDWVYMVNFSGDEKRVYSASMDKTIKVWDVESGKIITTLKGHDDGVIAFDISPNGNYLASTGMDKQIIIWDLKTLTQVEKFVASTEPVFTIKFSADGKKLFSAGKDNTIKVWECKYN